MAKIPVAVKEHLDLLNKVLKEQPDYVEGMAFAPAPEGSRGRAITGYDTTTPYESVAAYEAAVKIVNEMYEIVPGREA